MLSLKQNIMSNKELILSELESSFNFRYVIPAITSITFLNGNLKQVALQIKERWQSIMNANPWLVGKLIRNRASKRLQLAYTDESPIPEKVIDEMFRVNPSGLEIHDKMPYKQLLENVKPVSVKDGRLIINKQYPTTLLTLVADLKQNATKFTLIFLCLI